MNRLLRIAAVFLLAALLLTTAPAGAFLAPTFVSDEFNPCGPLPVWEQIANSVPGQGVTTNKTQLILTAAPGVDQTIWKIDPTDTTPGSILYNVPRVVQPFGGDGSEDFEVEVKFDSNVLQQFQQQGIVLEAGPGNLLRFEFYFDNTLKTVVYAAHVYTASDGSIVKRDLVPDPRTSADLTAATSLYLRVNRTGGVWSMSYKTETTDWAPAAILQPSGNFLVTRVGVYAGTSKRGSMAPIGHTAIVDYFFNSAAPIVNGDAQMNRLNVLTQGEGDLVVTPAQPADGFVCGQRVEVLANPASGWQFSRWEGAVVHSTNPAVLTMNGSDQNLTAIFTDDTEPIINYFIHLPLITQQ